MVALAIRERASRPVARAVALLLSCFAIGATLRAAAAEPLDPVVLALPSQYQFRFAGYFAALEMGYYRDAGLDVTILEGDSDRSPIDTVLDGEADFGTLGPRLLLERLKGEPLVALAVIFQHSPNALMARYDSGIVSPDDLVGRRVVLDEDARSTEFIAMFRHLGVDTGSIRFVSGNGDLDALSGGRVDAVRTYLGLGPVEMRSRGIPISIIQPSAYGIAFYGDTLFTSERELAGHPDRVEAFRMASLRGWSYAMGHVDEIADLIAAKYSDGQKISVEKLRAEAEVIRPLLDIDLVPVGYMNPERWMRMAAIFVETGMAFDSSSLDGFVYVPPDDTRRKWLRWAAIAGCAALAALAAFWFWNVQLRKVVDERTRALEVRNEALMRETSERLAAERQRTEALALLDMLYETAPVGLAFLDPDLRAVRMNMTLASMIGASASRPVGRRLAELAPGLGSKLEPFVLRVLAGEGPIANTEMSASAPTGSEPVRNWLGSYYPVRNSAGRMLGVGMILLDLTEQKRAEQALRESERRLRTLVEFAPDAIVILDAETGKFTEMNDNAVRLFGYDRVALSTMGPADVSPPRQPDGRSSETAGRSYVERAIAGDSPAFEWWHRNAAGRDIPCEVRLVRLPSAGRVLIRGSIVDLTERHQAIAALRRSQYLLERAQDVARIGSWVAVLNGDRQVTWSKELTRIYGIEEFDGKLETFLAMVHPEDRDAVVRANRATFEAAVPYSVDHRIVRPDGEVRWVHDQAEALLDSDSRPMQIIGVVQDITDRKKAEAALASHRERLELAIRGANLGTWDMDMKQGVLSISDRMAESLGWPRAEREFPSGAWFDMVHPQDRPRVQAAWQRCLRGETPIYEVEYRFCGIPGRTNWILSRGQIVERAPDGTPLRAAGTQLDVTATRVAEEQLLQAQKMEAVGQLTGGIAHDFNNLLAVVIGNLELLMQALDKAGRPRDLAMRAMGAAERGATLTQRLLAFSRRQALQPRAVDLGKLINGLADLLRRTLGEAIDLETVSAAGLWLCEADPVQIETAILNLAINARDAMPEGGKLTIEAANVRLDDDYAAAYAEVAPGQYVVLAVTDTGLGMTPDVQARAFEPFFTTKEVGRGSGLGLSMIYGFVKQSGGHVKIYSEANHGTTIKIYLPRATPAAEPASEKTAAIAENAGRGELVLVIEDDVAVRDLAVEQLEALGYRTLAAGDGPEGLKLIGAHPEIALLFSDVMLPGGMTGADLAREAEKLRPGLKVLFMSGYTRNAIVHHGRLDPGVELIEKPFRRAKLALKVRQILDRGARSG
jgi:PAS domain S-box-containing protein